MNRVRTGSYLRAGTLVVFALSLLVVAGIAPWLASVLFFGAALVLLCAAAQIVNGWIRESGDLRQHAADFAEDAEGNLIAPTIERQPPDQAGA